MTTPYINKAVMPLSCFECFMLPMITFTQYNLIAVCVYNGLVSELLENVYVPIEEKN